MTTYAMDWQDGTTDRVVACYAITCYGCSSIIIGEVWRSTRNRRPHYRCTNCAAGLAAVLVFVGTQRQES